MKLNIITSMMTDEFSVSWVELNTPSGTITIQKDHAPCIIELKKMIVLYFNLQQANKSLSRFNMALLTF